MADDEFDFEALVSGGYPLQRFEPDQRIFTQDDEGAAMYVVRSGKVGIMSAGAVLETIGPNGIFGEMSLIDGSPRSATAIAREPTELAVDRRARLLLPRRAQPCLRARPAAAFIQAPAPHDREPVAGLPAELFHELSDVSGDDLRRHIAYRITPAGVILYGM